MVLAHCAKVVRSGRTFSHRTIDLLSGLPDGNPRNNLSNEFKLDLQWWQEFSHIFNRSTCLIQHNFGFGPTFCTDASLHGYGLVIDRHCVAGYFGSQDVPQGVDSLQHDNDHWQNYHTTEDNINVLELIPILIAARRCGHKWRNQHVICFTDNTQIGSCVNRGTSFNSHSMALLRELFWLCATHNFYITARHIHSIDNMLPDLLSRIHASGDLTYIGLYFMLQSISLLWIRKIKGP